MLNNFTEIHSKDGSALPTLSKVMLEAKRNCCARNVGRCRFGLFMCPGLLIAYHGFQYVVNLFYEVWEGRVLEASCYELLEHFR